MNYFKKVDNFASYNHFKNCKIMKKVLFALVLVGGIFALSACSKECDCAAKWNGEVVYEQTVELSDGEKCSDYNGYVKVLGISAELKCTPHLF